MAKSDDQSKSPLAKGTGKQEQIVRAKGTDDLTEAADEASARAESGGPPPFIDSPGYYSFPRPRIVETLIGLGLSRPDLVPSSSDPTSGDDDDEITNVRPRPLS